MNTNSKVKTAVLVIALMGVAIPARADNDGISETNVGNVAVPGVHVNIANGAVDRTELSTGVQAELDGIATTNAAQDATLATHGTAIADHETRITTVEGTVAGQGVSIADHEVRIGTLETNDGLQDATLATHTGQITALQANDAAQDGTLTAHGAAIASHTATLANHETRITDVETVNGTQQTQIDTATSVNNSQQTTINQHTGQIATHTSQIAGVQAVNAVQDTRLGSLETVTAGHEVRLDAHDALLSQHASTLAGHDKRLDEQEKGLAIAMAMPDAWLSDKKNFGIFGAVGGFNDETALGFAAIGRIDETWSLNAKVGGDTEFKQFGWQVGAGAQW